MGQHRIRPGKTFMDSKIMIVLATHIVTFILSVCIYFSIAILKPFDESVTFFVSDVTGIVRGIIDTVCYALSISECRLELLKMFKFANVDLQRRAESIRLDVFSIPTYANNRVFTVMQECENNGGDGCVKETCMVTPNCSNVLPKEV
jgi:hypothetical protein